MGWVKLDLFKKQARADDFSADDAYLQHLLDVAESWVIAETNRTRGELEDMEGGEPPRPLAQAILLLASHWYNQREGVAATQMTEVPYTIQALVKPYVKLGRK